MTHLKNCGGGGMHVALHAAIVGYVPLGDDWHGAVPGGGSTTHVNIGGGGGGGGGGGFGGGGGGGGGGDAAGGCGHSQLPQHAQLHPVAHRWQQHASGMHMSPVSKRPVSMVWWSSSGHWAAECSGDTDCPMRASSMSRAAVPPGQKAETLPSSSSSRRAPRIAQRFCASRYTLWLFTARKKRHFTAPLGGTKSSIQL